MTHRLPIAVVIFISVLLLASGCQRRPKASGEDEVASLMKAERDASAQSAREGFKKSMLEHLSDSGVLLRPQHMPLKGIDARNTLESNSDTAYTLTWEPTEGIVAQSGDLGYTYGIYTLTIKANGNRKQGTYMTVWRKDKGGKWQMVLDTGNPGLEKEVADTTHKASGPDAKIRH